MSRAAAITTEETSPKNILETVETIDFSPLDAMQARIDPYLGKLQEGTQAEGCRFASSPHSIARTLQELLSRVAEVVEHHIFYKNDRAQTKENDARQNVANIQSYTQWKGVSHLFGGGAALVFGLAGIKYPIAEAIAKMSPQGAQVAQQFIDSWMQGEQFDEQMFLQLSSSDRQALEGLKGLLQQLQQELEKTGDMELQAIRSTNTR